MVSARRLTCTFMLAALFTPLFAAAPVGAQSADNLATPHSKGLAQEFGALGRPMLPPPVQHALAPALLVTHPRLTAAHRPAKFPGLF